MVDSHRNLCVSQNAHLEAGTTLMEFDPLELFTAVPSAFSSCQPRDPSALCKEHDAESDLTSELASQEDEDFVPLDVHDLPLLQCKPPGIVLILFLKLLAPDKKLNFGSSFSKSEELSPAEIFKHKGVSELVSTAMPWLSQNCPRFNSLFQLASIALLSSSFKANHSSLYNAWLTRMISHNLSWVTTPDRETVMKLASLRLAENCGRTAQPEIIREISIPYLEKKIFLKEPSLTADNLGLKTWGSSFILGCRLARDANSHHAEGISHSLSKYVLLKSSYLHGSVLELGAGTGLVGIVSCLLGYSTTLTDLPEITPNLRDNVDLNGVRNNIVLDLDWTTPTNFLRKYPDAQFTTIILSDPLYSSKHHISIVNMINTFLKKDHLSRVLIEIPKRRRYENERDSLWKLMDENGYVAVEDDIESGFDDFGESLFIFKKYIRRSEL